MCMCVYWVMIENTFLSVDCSQECFKATAPPIVTPKCQLWWELRSPKVTKTTSVIKNKTMKHAVSSSLYKWGNLSLEMLKSLINATYWLRGRGWLWTKEGYVELWSDTATPTNHWKGLLKIM